MKPILLALTFLFSIVSSPARSIIVNYTDGQSQTIDATAVSSIEFTPDQDADITGEYDCQLNVSLVEMPAMGTVVSEQTKFVISAGDEGGTYDIQLPSCSYSTMTLPGITVENVAITETDGNYTFDNSFSGTDNGRAYSGTLTGSINADGSFTVTESMKIGAMPFTLKMEYTPLSVE